MPLLNDLGWMFAALTRGKSIELRNGLAGLSSEKRKPTQPYLLSRGIACLLIVPHVESSPDIAVVTRMIDLAKAWFRPQDQAC